MTRCRACGTDRPLADLLAYWPTADPSAVGYCCRPSEARSRDVMPGQCFRRSVPTGPAWAIALAATPEPQGDPPMTTHTSPAEEAS